MARTGRPRIELNWKLFNGLCSVFCTQEEISAIMEVSIDTLEKVCKRDKRLTFTEYYKKASANGKASLRRAQYKSAVETENPTMMIWMGKQHLGQTDKQAEDPTLANQALMKISDLMDKAAHATSLQSEASGCDPECELPIKPVDGGDIQR